MDPIRIESEFPTEEACLDYLEKLRWPQGVRCLDCDAPEISRIVTRGGVRSKVRVNQHGEPVKQRIPSRRLFQCLKCGRQFNARSGTVFNDSRLPLRKWFHAVALIANAPEGVSARQLQQELNVGYQTAWYLCHRLRETL